ncbi:MAG: carbamoyl-phosphate synthase (glutamine-hydrolyzing) small subunit [Candidatus Lokiarchaeota archaeon]|nr:carbamoyl-phosphate synthase (glutamine-hydrolyzing) small subunit [Candidatus Lokiarchaeota archaeon]
MLDEERKAVLILNDGTIFEGIGFGASKKVSGEVVFNTGMVGYPESLTDPSYHGQILTLTYPLIGNYGVPDQNVRDKWNLPKYFESDFKLVKPGIDPPKYEEEKKPNGIKPFGLVVHELCKQPNHWESKMSLDDWLMREGIPGIEEIDTRELTKKLRVHGVMLGIIQVCDPGEEPDLEALKEEVKSVEDPNDRDLVKEVSIKEPIIYDNNSKITIAIIDTGMKLNILKLLLQNGVNVVRLPYDVKIDDVLKYNPTGFFITNGPGDPEKNIQTIVTTRELINEQKLPLFGICLGNQIFSLAMGAKTYKLKYGHRSQNQPAIELETGRCFITTQNHGFAVDNESLKGTGLKAWFLNANDKTIEGIKHESAFAYTVQFHPEYYPGPIDAEYLIRNYIKELEETVNA